MGNLLAVCIHAANIHDTKGGRYVFETALYNYPSITACCADEGYRGTFKNTFETYHNIRVDISKQIKPKFEVLPKRWRVERTFAWANNSRRLAKDYEISTSSAEAMFMISHLHTLLKRL
jgi:transposase